MVGRLVRLVTRVVLLGLLLSPLTSAQTPAPEAAIRTGPPSAPVVENVGQWDARARFQAWGGPGTTWLAEDAIWITLLEPSESEGQRAPKAGVNLRLTFEGANPHPALQPYGASPSKVSYFRGSDPVKWRPDAPVWTGVRYVDLYPGLDLEIGAAAGGWSWRMVARKGAAMDLSSVRLRIEGVEQVSIDGGRLTMQTALGPVGLPLLEAVDATGTPVDLSLVAARVSDAVISAPFAVALDGQVIPAVDTSTLWLSTFLGGDSWDYGQAIALDGADRIFVLSLTWSTDYPTTPGAFDPSKNGVYSDAAVSVLNSAGTALVYSTYLGAVLEATDIAVDHAGRAFIAGTADSGSYPTTVGAYDSGYNGGYDAFVSALNASGTGLVYSTFLGGSGDDLANGMALDAGGRAYVVGKCDAGFPTTAGAYDTTHGTGLPDAFVTVLNASGSSLVYSTFLGGNEFDGARAIALDATGRAYVTGEAGTGFPTTVGAFDTTPCAVADCRDAFVSVLNASGSALVYSTLLGGSGDDEGTAIALGSTGQAYVTGSTESTDLPTTSTAYDKSFGGWKDAFVSTLNSAGSGLVYSTYLGGTSRDLGTGIAVDSGGYAYLSASIYSPEYPTTANAYDTTHHGTDTYDAVLTVLNETGSGLVYSTFLGGAGDDEANGIVLGKSGRAYMAGRTESADFPTTAGAYDTTSSTKGDAVVAVLLKPSAGTHFDAASEWWDGLKAWAPQNRYPRMLGDVNGDGRDDAIAFNPDLGAYVALSTGSGLIKPAQWTSEFGWLQGSYNWRALGDVDGDSRADIVGFDYGDGIYVGLSTGTRFAASSEWRDTPWDMGPQTVEPRLVGDVNWDGMADVVACTSGGVIVFRSTGSSFLPPEQWSSQTDWMSNDKNWVALGDVDGDADADLVNFRYGEGVYVALSSGDSFGPRMQWWTGLVNWGPDNRNPRLVGDVTGDGRADIVAWDPERGAFVGVSTGTAFAKPVQWSSDFAIKSNAYNLHALGDLNGDGRDDAVCFLYGDGVGVAVSSW